jgi:hypothetical protein
MDNLVVHKTIVVMKAFEDLNMVPIYSIPYSPQYNGIESYFFLVKQQYKKRLLQRIMKDQSLDIRRLIHESIKAVEDWKTKNCCDGGLKEVFDIE